MMGKDLNVFWKCLYTNLLSLFNVNYSFNSMNNIKYVIARWTFQLCDYCCLRSNIHTLIMACRSISELDELMLLHKGFEPAVINHVSLPSQLHIISNYWYFFGQLRCQLYITLGSVITLFYVIDFWRMFKPW